MCFTTYISHLLHLINKNSNDKNTFSVLLEDIQNLSFKL